MQTRSAEPIDRCVIWTPRGRHAPEELVGVLEKRGFHIAHAARALTGTINRRFPPRKGSESVDGELPPPHLPKYYGHPLKPPYPGGPDVHLSDE